MEIYASILSVEGKGLKKAAVAMLAYRDAGKNRCQAPRRGRKVHRRKKKDGAPRPDGSSPKGGGGGGEKGGEKKEKYLEKREVDLLEGGEHPV